MDTGINASGDDDTDDDLMTRMEIAHYV